MVSLAGVWKPPALHHGSVVLRLFVVSNVLGVEGFEVVALRV